MLVSHHENLVTPLATPPNQRIKIILGTSGVFVIFVISVLAYGFFVAPSGTAGESHQGKLKVTDTRGNSSESSATMQF